MFVCVRESVCVRACACVCVSYIYYIICIICTAGGEEACLCVCVYNII